MVYLRNILFSAQKMVRRTKFVDGLRVYVKGGFGGKGLQKYGGKGGRGGHVYVVGQEEMTLRNVRIANPSKRFKAKPGEDSRPRCLLGAAGADVEIPVPLGVCVKDDSGKVLGDVIESGDKVLIAKGGDGGSPETRFHGQPGEALSVKLDLKLIADVGLVGFPNAGKSTLLSAVSRAAPKIANYPFTTIQPQLGIMIYDDKRQIAMADLPGLIEGAHVNVGMGHKFLKHVERTKLLLFVVDLQGFRLSPQLQARSAFETILLLNKELELYREDLLTKPAILALNKTDKDGADDRLQETMELLQNLPDSLTEVKELFRPKQLVKFEDIFAISAKQKSNTNELKERIRELLDEFTESALAEERAHAEAALAARKTELKEHFPGIHLV